MERFEGKDLGRGGVEAEVGRLDGELERLRLREVGKRRDRNMAGVERFRSTLLDIRGA